MHKVVTALWLLLAIHWAIVVMQEQSEREAPDRGWRARDI
jgi:hypothetical protein